MSSPDKPTTPEGEKMQVKLASKMFEEGTTVKEGSRDAFMASNRRDERSNLMSRVGAESASISRTRLNNSRSGGEFKTVDGGVDVQSTGISATGKGGRSYGTEGDIVRQDTSSTARVARSMAAAGQQRSLSDFTDSNKKTQAFLDIGVAATSAYARSDGFKEKNNEEIGGEVSIFSPLSASNYDEMGRTT